jgi:hypothetical protein
VSRKPCGRPIFRDGQGGTCPYERAPGKQRCIWHWLASQPAHVQAAHAAKRLEDWNGRVLVARVPKNLWPDGERWCAGCQSYVPLFYTSGSRCKACASSAAHASRIEKEYGITGEEYDALLRAQGGVCFICQRKPRTKRLAVDHDHKTGEVRGLLCANNEMGCNRAIVGNLEAANGGGVAAARRTLLYLTLTPWERLTNGGDLSWEQFCRDELIRIEHEKNRPTTPPTYSRYTSDPPPF